MCVCVFPRADGVCMLGGDSISIALAKRNISLEERIVAPAAKRPYDNQLLDEMLDKAKEYGRSKN